MLFEGGNIMKKYRYVEFVDGLWRSPVKRGRLYIVAEEPEAYREEFSLIEESVRGETAYYTTLEKIGALGWELAFVTTCGSLRENGGQMLQNAYVFKKEIEE